jgi:hypothetical protein
MSTCDANFSHRKQQQPNLDTHLIERLCEKLRPIPMRDIAVLRMALEKVRLRIERVSHALVDVDVLLRAVYDADEAELERVHAPRQYVERVRARVHQVELRQDADRPPSLRVYRPRKLQGLGISKVDVSS